MLHSRVLTLALRLGVIDEELVLLVLTAKLLLQPRVRDYERVTVGALFVENLQIAVSVLGRGYHLIAQLQELFAKQRSLRIPFARKRRFCGHTKRSLFAVGKLLRGTVV